MFKKIRSIYHIGIGVLSALSIASGAYATGCAQHYPQGQVPIITNEKVAVSTTELCYKAFAVMHSGVTRTPLWSSEHLVRKNIELARAMPRKNSFHADTNLPLGERAELKDYARSGFDRGHMEPNGNMPTPTAQHESFSLANMVPQNPNNNRYIWEGMESAVRRLAKNDGDIYVLSGPAFIGTDLQQVGNVLVPTHLFKVVYRPRTNQAAAYFVKNEATKDYTVISVAQLEKTVGIDLLPGVSQHIKDVAANLPRPTPHNEGDDVGIGKKRSYGNRSGAKADYRLDSKLLNAVEEFIRSMKRSER